MFLASYCFGMKSPNVYVLVFMTLVGADALGASRTISSVEDTNPKVTHHATTATKGPAEVTCVDASQIPGSPSGKPSCYIQGPGVSRAVPTGDSVGSTGAGTIILSCSGVDSAVGPPNHVTCSARVDD